MKRRVLSMILTIVMVWSLLPVTAYAATTISTVAITGVDVPVAGATPDYTAVTGLGYNPTNEFNEAGKKVSGVSWYNKTDKKQMSTTDVFEQGKVYEIAIAIKVADGYEFSASDNYTSTTTATVNGNSAGMGMVISGYSAKEILTVNYTFGACDYARIEEVAVTGIDIPVPAETPDITGVVDENANYILHPDDPFTWYDVTSGKDSGMYPGDTFIAGHQYALDICFKVKNSDTHRFKLDKDNCPDIIGTVNGLPAENVSAVADNVATIRFVFACNGEDITSVIISGIDKPIEGSKPDFLGMSAATGYSFYTNAASYPNGVEWYDETAEGAWSPTEDTFVGGHQYTVTVRIKANEGYDFKEKDGELDITATLNGETVAAGRTTVNGTEVIILTKTYECIGNISNVDLTIPEPVDGNTPDTTQIVADKYCSLGTKGTTLKNGFKWHDDKADKDMDLTGTSTFKEGNKYTVSITLDTNDGFKFLESTTATVNGKTANCTYGSSSNVTVQYTFTAAHACKITSIAKVDATCTTDGKQAYYHCDGCDKNYEDEAGTKEIADITNWGVIKATGHTIEIQNKKDATETEAGYTGDEYCTVCKKVITPGKTIEKLPAKEPEVKPAAKGETVTDTKTKAKYVVTKSDATNGTVAFSKPKNKNITAVTIPSTVTIDGITYKVTSIQKNAFSGCKKLKSVTIGSNITTIGDKAFYKCTKLSKITIPAKVSKIGKQAFYGCKKLATITIKTKKLTSKKVGSKAFTGTPKNAKVKVPSKSLKSYKKFLYKKGLNKKAKIKR